MEEIMKEYDELHQKDSECNYLSDSDSENDTKTETEIDIESRNKILANDLHNNYENMSIEEKQKTLLKCMNIYGIGRELLKFELKNYIPISKYMNTDQFINTALRLMKRYQCKAGGFYLEDYEWTVYYNDFKNIDVASNEIYFENSLDKNNAKDNETIRYMDRITCLLNKIALNVTISYKFYESKNDDITWVFIKAKFKNNIPTKQGQKKKIKIGL